MFHTLSARHISSLAPSWKFGNNLGMNSITELWIAFSMEMLPALFQWRHNLDIFCTTHSSLVKSKKRDSAEEKHWVDGYNDDVFSMNTLHMYIVFPCSSQYNCAVHSSFENKLRAKKIKLILFVKVYFKGRIIGSKIVTSPNVLELQFFALSCQREPIVAWNCLG